MLNNLFNHEYENAILGALLLNNETLDEVVESISRDDFHKPLNRKIFQEILNIINSNEYVDIQILCHRFDKKYTPDIVKLTSCSTANISFYCHNVRDLSRKRKLLILSGKISENLKSDICVDKTVEMIDSELTHFKTNKSNNFYSIKDLIPMTLRQIEDNYRNNGLSGIKTGYNKYDYFTGGLQKSELIIIGARPSIGKTAFALNIAEYIANNNIPVGFFSLEMSAKDLCMRILSGNSKISQREIRNGKLFESDFEKLNITAQKIYDKPLFIYDYPNAKLFDIKIKARYLLRKYNIKIFFIDYLSLIQYPGNMPRNEKYSMISSELKALARELDIPVVVLSQVGRQAEDSTPILSDIRESGSIEQDADVVMFLDRKRGSSVTELIIAKNRNGTTGTIPLKYIASETRFYNASA